MENRKHRKEEVQLPQKLSEQCKGEYCEKANHGMRQKAVKKTCRLRFFDCH